MNLYIYVCIYICIYIQLYIYNYIYIYLYIYINCIYIYRYVYIYSYICVHTFHMAPVPHPEELLVRSVSGADRCAGLRSEHHRRLRRLAADAEPLQVSWQMGGDGGHGGGLFKGIFTMKHRDLADLNHEEWILKGHFMFFFMPFSMGNFMGYALITGVLMRM